MTRSICQQKGLKLIPTHVTKQTQMKSQILRHFDQLARRMRPMYIFHRQASEPHPLNVKSTQELLIQRLVALENYQPANSLSVTTEKNFGEGKTDEFRKRSNQGSFTGQRATQKRLKANSETSILQRQKIICQSSTQRNNHCSDERARQKTRKPNTVRQHNRYRPSEKPMVTMETEQRVQQQNLSTISEMETTKMKSLKQVFENSNLSIGPEFKKKFINLSSIFTSV